jgi:hypothetical protein
MKMFRNILYKSSIFSSIYIIFILMAFSKNQVLIQPEGSWGPGYSVSNGVHLEGVTGKNRVIYDNDWFYDVLDAGYLVAKHKLGELDLRGIIVTADFFYGDGKINEGINDFTIFRNNAISSGINTVPNYFPGANARLIKPVNGKISDTAYTRTSGSDLIVAEAKLSTPDNPLVIFVGGPATTVATALLQDPSIADKILVLMCDLTDYNNKDSWSIFIVAQRTSFFAYPFILNHGFSEAIWEQLPNNPLCDHFHTPLVKRNAVGDGALLAWFFNNNIVTNVEKKNMIDENTWESTNSSPYGFLYIEKSTFNFDGTAICQQMVNTLKDPKVYL